MKSLKTCLWFLAWLLPAAAFAQNTATIEGRVRLPAPAPGAPINQRYDVVTTGRTVSTNPPLAVVYLEGKFPRPSEPPVAQMSQRDLAFVPALLAVQTGTRVEFPNEDDTFHNVFSYSKPKRFDLGRYPPNEKPSPSQVFDKPGLITLRCEIHEHMRGLILVLDTPHFIVTDPEGRFRLTGLPAGKFTLKAWINSEETRIQPVDIGEGATLQVDFP